MITAFYSLLTFTLLGLHADSAELDPATDLGRLQGTWVAKTGPRKSIHVTLEVTGTSASFTIKLPTGMKIHAEGHVRLDESMTPKAMDWIKFVGPDAGELPEIPAIYRLEGNSFVVCSGGLNSGRPQEFQRGEGLLTEVVTFERVDGKPGSNTVAALPVSR